MKKRSISIMVFVVVFGVIATFSYADERSGVSEDEIIIGLLGPTSGPVSHLGPMIEMGGRLAAKQINDTGGIYGRKLRVIMGDSACSASTGVATLKKMVYNQNVFAVTGIGCSHVGLAIRPILEKEGVPLIITIAQSSNILEQPNKGIFRIIPPLHISGPLFAKFMKDLFPEKVKKSSIIYSKGEFGQSSTDALVAQLAKYGITPLAIETHTIGDSDYSSQILKIKELGTEVLFLMTYTSDEAKILKQSNELGLHCIKMGHNGVDFAVFPAIAGKQALKDFYGPTWLEDAINGPKLKGFRDMYTEHYPRYMSNPNNPSSSDVSCYSAIHVIAEGIRRAGKDLTRTKFIKSLESLENFRPNPWHPPVTFSPADHEGLRDLALLHYVDGVCKLYK